MKKIFSVLLSLVMLLGVAPVSAFAAETDTVPVEVITVTSSDEEIVPYANPTDLVYVENATIPSSVTNTNYDVNPSKGRSLRVWIKSNNQINVTVRRVGLISYPKEYGQTFGAGERDVETVASCNGGHYIVQISGPAGTVYSMLIYETGG